MFAANTYTASHRFAVREGGNQVSGGTDTGATATKRARVFAIVNQKGGVGKSTTAVNLTACLGDAGKKVLLVDLDPQGNATSGYGLNKNQRQSCIYDALLGGEPMEGLIEPVEIERVFVVPATIQLAGAEIELVSAMSREGRLKSILESVVYDFDYIIIDCPPSLGLLTINALTAANGLIVPIQCEYYALEGLSKLLDSVRLVKAHLNPELEVFGVVMTMYDVRTRLSQQVVDEVRDFFGERVFESLIPRSVRLSEAPSFGQPVTLYDPTGKGADSYRALAKEVIDRVD
ncbi:MAG: ParA family protein [Clostridiales bacterium]|nr:ParA family protein [Clostridiales bacterium]